MCVLFLVNLGANLAGAGGKNYRNFMFLSIEKCNKIEEIVTLFSYNQNKNTYKL